MRDLMKLVRMLAWAAVAAAIYQELRKPPEERAWHGRVGGVIPYDFRIPTLDRLRRAYWDPGSDVVFSDHVWGVGWAVNIPVFARKASDTLRHYVQVSREMGEQAAERLRPEEPAG